MTERIFRIRTRNLHQNREEGGVTQETFTFYLSTNAIKFKSKLNIP